MAGLRSASRRRRAGRPAPAAGVYARAHRALRGTIIPRYRFLVSSTPTHIISLFRVTLRDFHDEVIGLAIFSAAARRTNDDRPLGERKYDCERANGRLPRPSCATFSSSPSPFTSSSSSSSCSSFYFFFFLPRPSPRNYGDFLALLAKSLHAGCTIPPRNYAIFSRPLRGRSEGALQRENTGFLSGETIRFVCHVIAGLNISR